MHVQLTPSWALTDEHSASSYGQPVLVQKDSPEAYGQLDIVRCYPSWPLQPARDAVARMAKLHPELESDEKAFVAKFTE